MIGLLRFQEGVERFGFIISKDGEEKDIDSLATHTRDFSRELVANCIC